LQPNEITEATTDLTEAYIATLSIEKSLTKKDRLLKTADAEGLRDERLHAFRAEVDSLLQRRKKIIMLAALITGGVLLLIIVVAVLLK
jgi:hypothetical protein